VKDVGSREHKRNPIMTLIHIEPVPFGPDEIRAVSRGEKPQCRMAILTSQTCGEPCWHAEEDICRCSCGGKNHGCLKDGNGKQPIRTRKIAGERYKLVAVGSGCRELAQELNGRQWKQVEKPFRDQNGRLHQYRYHWRETDPGAPARVLFASQSEVDRWPELAAYKGQRERPCVCWEIEVWPDAPREAVIQRGE